MKNGGICGMPTDTVYVLVAACNRPDAVVKAFKWVYIFIWVQWSAFFWYDDRTPLLLYLSTGWRNRRRTAQCPCGSPLSNSWSQYDICWALCSLTSWRPRGPPPSAWLYPEVGVHLWIHIWVTFCVRVTLFSVNGVLWVSYWLLAFHRPMDGHLWFRRCCQTHRDSTKYCNQIPRLCCGHTSH